MYGIPLVSLFAGYVISYYLHLLILFVFNMQNMRLIILISLLVLTVSCADTKKSTSGSNLINSSKFNGTWVPVKQELNGTLLPAAAFKTQKLVINDSAYTFTAESVDKGVVKYRNNKMDIYGKQGVNMGKHFTAIYKFENGQLTICYNLSGNNYPETFETKGRPAFFLSVFEKETVK